MAAQLVEDEAALAAEQAAAAAENVWDPPCENCVRSIVSGKGTSFRCSDSTGRSKRRPELVPLARRCVRAFEEDDGPMKKRCRGALALMIELLDAQDPCFGTNVVAAGSAVGQSDREKAQEAWKVMSEFFFRS
ncbi:hypothetical protein ACHAQJ_000689 [Trichoderma viride]